jgi:polysaccharide export outer membrane protein
MHITQNKFILLFFGILLFASCAEKKDILYFNDISNEEQNTTVLSESKIQVDDILSILVSSNSTDLASLYNLSTSNSVSTSGYLVTLNGTITMPILGKIKVENLTPTELELFLVRKLIDEKHLLNPTVTVRLLNAKFTILGEVKNPGTYTFNEQNISLLQALGYAGDLTINGKRKDILIIREEDHKRTYITIDLTSKKWFQSPYYYIKPNDVIYINPNGPKVNSSGYISNLNGLLGIASIVVTSILLLTR